MNPRSSVYELLNFKLSYFWGGLQAWFISLPTVSLIALIFENLLSLVIVGQ